MVGVFTAIIPTMQRAPELWPLVDMLVAHPRVVEILVINNVPEPLSWESEKVRVLNQGTNIFVNPAWNLGASESKSDLLAIINDDISFDSGLLDEAERLLLKRWVGMVGPAPVTLNATGSASRAGWRFASTPNKPFGTLMCLRRRDYFAIPDSFLIWGGDDWLFRMQRGINLYLQGFPIHTDMSATAQSPEFQDHRLEEALAFEDTWRRAGQRRWWHLPARLLLKFRLFRGQLLR